MVEHWGKSTPCRGPVVGGNNWHGRRAERRSVWSRVKTACWEMGKKDIDYLWNCGQRPGLPRLCKQSCDKIFKSKISRKHWRVLSRGGNMIRFAFWKDNSGSGFEVVKIGHSNTLSIKSFDSVTEISDLLLISTTDGFVTPHCLLHCFHSLYLLVLIFSILFLLELNSWNADLIMIVSCFKNLQWFLSFSTGWSPSILIV